MKITNTKDRGAIVLPIGPTGTLIDAGQTADVDEKELNALMDRPDIKALFDGGQLLAVGDVENYDGPGELTAKSKVDELRAEAIALEIEGAEGMLKADLVRALGLD